MMIKGKSILKAISKILLEPSPGCLFVLLLVLMGIPWLDEMLTHGGHGFRAPRHLCLHKSQSS